MAAVMEMTSDFFDLVVSMPKDGILTTTQTKRSLLLT